MLIENSQVCLRKTKTEENYLIREERMLINRTLRKIDSSKSHEFK